MKEYDAIEIAFKNGYEKGKAEVEQLIYKLECLLCHATGGKLSKHTYDLRTMETAVTDYINESYDEGYKDGKTDGATEIFEEIEKLHLHITNEFDATSMPNSKRNTTQGGENNK